MPDLIFDNPDTVAFEISTERRTITGLALPFGDVADNGHGRFSFSAGSLTWGKVKVLDGHDWHKAVGTAELTETPAGIRTVMKIAPGARGDEVLALAGAGVYDGLSVGLAADAKFAQRDGINYSTSGTIREVSLTPIPAFQRASVTSVAASAAPHQKGKTVPNAQPTTEVAPGAADFDAAIQAAVAAAFASHQAGTTLTVGVEPGAAPAVPAREVVPAAPAGAIEQFQVTEPAVYRFDGLPGEHDFSTDLFDAIRFKSGEAKERLERFMAGQAFAAVATTDVSSVNPNTYRPDLYVDSYVLPTPVYTAIYKGPLSSSTPFVVPKFSTSSGWVTDHTEGTEPTEGSFGAGAQTVTPKAVSGLAKITREVIDAGGNPQVSGLIWTEMQRAYANAMEVKAAALLTGATVELGAALATTDTQPGQVAKIEAALSAAIFSTTFDFAYFDTFLADSDLWRIVTTAKDADGRALYPQLAAANANGQTGRQFKTAEIGGFDLTPAKTLPKGKGYIFDRSFGGFWASGIQRIALPETVAVETSIGVFGYYGSAILDGSKIRKVTSVTTNA